MAGSVAKIVYSNNLFGDAAYSRPSRSLVGNMEADDVVTLLNDTCCEKRAEILETLRGLLRRNGGRLPYVDQKAIFRGLSAALTDNNWEIRHYCLQLIHELIPQFGEDLDECMSIVLPKIVTNMGDGKVAIRRDVIQTLHLYMKHTEDVQALLHGIVRYGLENADSRIKKEVVVGLPMLFTPEFSQEDFFEITRSLAKRLLDDSTEDNLQQHVLLSMEKIRNLVGDANFKGYLQSLPSSLQGYYFKLSNQSDTPFQQTSVAPTRQDKTSPEYTEKDSPDQCEFGIVPSYVMLKLNDQSNFRTRAQGVDELKAIIKNLRDVSPLHPHLLNFISFLNNLLDDSNFKIITVTLEILGSLVDVLSLDIQPYLKPVVLAMTKRMDDNKIVVRQAIMKVVMQLMHLLSPKPVLTVICDNLAHRNSRLRQETLNVVIASLLTFPSYEFDLPLLCQKIAYTLVDSKRQVRQAALECLAVLAQAMGAGKLQALVHAVDTVELSCEGDGVMAAVQARLARRQLPRLNADRLVDYTMPVPTSAGSHARLGADAEWVLSASGGSGSSARSHRSMDMELESVTSSARSTPTNFLQDGSSSPYGPYPRRHLSAGKGRSRLPWEEAGSTEQNGDFKSPPGAKQAGTKVEDDAHTVKLRASLVKENGSSDGKKVIRRRNTGGFPISGATHDSVDSSSYKQIYRTKYKKQFSDGESVPYSVYSHNKELETASRSGVYGSAHSTPRNSDQLVSYSSSWPDPQMFDDAIKPHKRFLDPISGMDNVAVPYTPVRYADSMQDAGKSADTPLIPTKATLARSTSSKRKVPPIPLSERARWEGDSIEGMPEREISLDSLLDGTAPSDEMANSLRQIRNSATKKKVEKMFERLEHKQQKQHSPKSRSPSPTREFYDMLDDSAIFSQQSETTGDVSEASMLTTPKKKGKKGDSPFEVRPRLARKNSTSSIKFDQPPSPGSEIRVDLQTANESVGHIDFKPLGGVTFRENRNSDVQIVGKGYAEDAQPTEPKPYAAKARERRRFNKTILSPLGMASVHTTGAVDLDDDKVPGGVVGKGMFDVNSNAMEQSTVDHRTRHQSRSDGPTNNPLRGVYGVGVHPGSQPADDTDSADEEEDVSSMAMSQTTRNRLSQKVRQKQEEAAERRKADEDSTDQKRTCQRERQKVSHLLAAGGDTGSEALSIGGSYRAGAHKPQSRNPKPATITRQKNKPNCADTSGDEVLSECARPSKSFESDISEDLQPLKDPNAARNDAMKALAQDSWDVKCHGMNIIRRLAMHHPDVLCIQLHSVVVAVMQEIKNLRSQVARQAIGCLGDMFTHLRKNMDAELDQTAKVLLTKSVESNAFIREDIEKALTAMTQNTTLQRTLPAIINGGASHRSVIVRKTCAQFVSRIVDVMGPGRLLSGVKDTTDKLLPTTAQFMLDGSNEMRYYAQKIFYVLMSHHDFEKMMDKYVARNVLRNIQDRLDNLRKKGLGEPPIEVSSARARRSGQGSRSGSSTRGNSASSMNDSSSSTTPLNGKRRSMMRTDEATLSEMKAMSDLMAAGDWRDRQHGIQSLQTMAENSPDIVGHNIVKMFDKFIPCLKDSNSKVNLQALQVLLELTPLLSDYMASVINLVIQTVTSNLSSKNKDIFEAASAVLDCLMDHIDGALLLQPFADQVQSGNQRVKPDMIDRVAYLVLQVYPRKQKQVLLHVLPLLWHLLACIAGTSTGGGSSGSAGGPSSAGGSSGGSLRDATANLIQALHSQMGASLMEHASSNSRVMPRMHQLLQSLIDAP